MRICFQLWSVNTSSVWKNVFIFHHLTVLSAVLKRGLTPKNHMLCTVKCHIKQVFFLILYVFGSCFTLRMLAVLVPWLGVKHQFTYLLLVPYLFLKKKKEKKKKENRVGLQKRGAVLVRGSTVACQTAHTKKQAPIYPTVTIMYTSTRSSSKHRPEGKCNALKLTFFSHPCNVCFVKQKNNNIQYTWLTHFWIK